MPRQPTCTQPHGIYLLADFLIFTDSGSLERIIMVDRYTLARLESKYAMRHHVLYFITLPRFQRRSVARQHLPC